MRVWVLLGESFGHEDLGPAGWDGRMRSDEKWDATKKEEKKPTKTSQKDEGLVKTP